MNEKCNAGTLTQLIGTVVLLLTVQLINGQNLFSSDPNVDQLSATDFVSKVHHSRCMWIIDFYASWCGYCQRLAPDFSRFASKIQTWKPVVCIGAVACSDFSNSGVCRDYDITGYPTIKLFPPDAARSELGRYYYGDKSVSSLSNLVLDYLDELVKSNRMDSSWPVLSFMGHVGDLWKNGRKRHSFVIVENSHATETHLGMKVILDLLDLSDDVAVGRMTLSHARLYEVYHHGLYTLTLFSQLYPVNVEFNREAIVHEIRRHYATGGSHNVQQTTTVGPVQSTTPFTKTAEGVHMQDLESGLFYSLWVEVPSRNVLDDSNLEAMKQYIEVLAKYLPAEEHITNFLHKINRWIRRRTQAISAGEWLDHITNSQDNSSYVPNRIRWTWCRGSQPQFRGYPCSLWMTFHTLTINAYLRERHNQSYTPSEVIGAIRGYVEHFLGCRDCARNFERGAAKVLDGNSPTATRYRQRRDGAAMWLWYSHNRANYFLASDPTEDPLFPKVQFPAPTSCPMCHQGNGTDDWVDSAVFDYLLHYYRASKIIDDDPHDGYNPTDSGGGTTAETTTTPPGDDDRRQLSDEGDGGSCRVETTEWSACSKTCDVGMSTRQSNDNDDCVTRVETRLCQLRPCHIIFPDWTRSSWHQAN